MLKSINLRNLYAFGDSGTPELKNFNLFNLFIGKNGSGKSNVIRAMCNLDVIPVYDEKKKNYTYILDHEIRRISYIEPVQTEASPYFDLILEYDNEIVCFENQLHCEGDFIEKKGEHILANDSIHLFERNLKKLNSDSGGNQLLSFTLTYIFQHTFHVLNGEILELFTKQDGLEKGNFGKAPLLDQWSSGFFSVANLLMRILLSNKNILCIDEPETHLEPKILKRLMDIIIWLSLMHTKEYYLDISYIKRQWEKWLEIGSFNGIKDNKSWEDRNKKITNNKPKQIFIASHSSVMINEFLSRSSICSIYEFDCDYEYSGCTYYENEVKKEINQVSLVTNIKAIKGPGNNILDNLGASGSDILQANGVVWVEGPSDVIYIRKWLEMYAKENNLPELRQGYHYEYQMYGGTLLDSLCCMKDELSKEDEMKKLVSLFSFSRNAYLITDSDAVKESGITKDNSNFGNAKEFIAKQFEEFNQKGSNLGIWYNKHDLKARTIEDYIDKYSKSCNGSVNRPSKKLYAEKVTKSWTDRKKLKSFKYNLEQEIENLYKTISSWNVI